MATQMTGEVPKKIIEKSSAAPHLSEGTPPQRGSLDLDGDMDEPFVAGGFPPTQSDEALTESPPGRNAGNSHNGFSLDALEISEENHFDLPSKSWDDGAPAAQEPENAPKEERGHWRLRILAQKKMIAIGVSCLSLVLLLGAALTFWTGESNPPLPIVTQLKKPIPFPLHQEKLDFFLLANAQSEKSIVSLDVELEFRSTRAHQWFKDENVLFRDVVYRFLESQRPSKNTQKEWGKIVQNDLMNHLKTTLPQGPVDQIRISRFERL